MRSCARSEWLLHVGVLLFASSCKDTAPLPDAGPYELVLDASLDEHYSAPIRPPPSDCLQKAGSFQGPNDFVYTIDWSPKSSLLLAGTIGIVRVLDADVEHETLREVATFSHADSQVYAQWSPDGEYAVSAGEDIRLIRIAGEPISVAEVARYTGHTGAIIAVAWSRDGRYLLTGAKDESVRVLEVDRERSRLEERAVLHAHVGRVFGVAWSPDGRHAMSTGEDGTLRLLALDADGGKLSELAQVRGVDWKNSVAWGDAERPVLSGDWGLFNRVQTWSVDPDAGHIELQGVLTDFDRVGTQVIEWNPAGSALVVAAHDDNGLQLFSYANGHFQGVGTLKNWSYGIHAATWSPDGTHVAFAAAYGERITLLDLSACAL